MSTNTFGLMCILKKNHFEYNLTKYWWTLIGRYFLKYLGSN
jgi:hypothetical protein